jgi:hypothetical protein
MRKSIFFCTLVFAIFSFFAPDAQAQSRRDTVRMCWQNGAINSSMMLQCSGMNVDPQTFMSCMEGGACLGEPPTSTGRRGRFVTPGAPFCGGAVGTPACFTAVPCGFNNTISCNYASACGYHGFPPCSQPLACGAPHTLQCPQTTSTAPRRGRTFDSINPSFVVALPSSEGGSSVTGVNFARPPLPDKQRLTECHAKSGTDKAAFGRCVVSHAMPKEYRIVEQCMVANQNDGGAAMACSTGNQEVISGYKKVKEFKSCYDEAQGNRWEMAQCVGNQTLPPKERRYMGCITRNRGDFKAAAVCALLPELTPEQQIALSCAISTGGVPAAFAACTGGQLLSRELDKCLSGGLFTEKGCFGPNNDYRKFLDTVDGRFRQGFGQNSEAYKAFSLWKNNVLAPGHNHDVVRHLNNSLNDLRDGPGPNNDIVRAGQSLEAGVRSVGSFFGL